MKPVAVLGAGGFVGQSLLESFVLEGCGGARAVVRNYRNMAGLSRFGSAVDIVRGDAEDTASLAKAVDGMDTVVNLTTGPPAGIVRATRTIFQACTEARVRCLIHLSSAVVYGDVERPTGDDDPPISKHWMPYARAKAASETWLRQNATVGGPAVIVLRPGIVWGPRSPHTLAIARSLAAKNAAVVGQGEGLFNGIYIANLIASIRTCCGQPAPAAGFYNVSDAETVIWGEFLAVLGPALGCDPARLPSVDPDRFPRSLRSMLEDVQSLPFMNELYHRVKGHVPDALKARLRARLQGAYRYERHADDYATSSAIDREMWHLQRVKHKLAGDKFRCAFNFEPPVSFREGMRPTIVWLNSLGLVASACAEIQD